MELYLLRHGDAVQKEVDDSLRPLSHEGELEIAEAALYLGKRCPSIDFVFCSPLVRAKQSAEIVLKKVQARELIVHDSFGPGGNPALAITMLNANRPASALIVGHEPYLGILISLLAGGPKIAVSKGALALVNCRLPVQPGKGSLAIYLTPREMNKIQNG